MQARYREYSFVRLKVKVTELRDRIQNFSFFQGFKDGATYWTRAGWRNDSIHQKYISGILISMKDGRIYRNEEKKTYLYCESYGRIANALIVYKIATKKSIKIRRFRELLAAKLLGLSCRNLQQNQHNITVRKNNSGIKHWSNDKGLPGLSSRSKLIKNFWKNTKKQRNRREEEEEEEKGQRAKSRFVVDDRNVLGNWANQRFGSHPGSLYEEATVNKTQKNFLFRLAKESGSDYHTELNISFNSGV
ncbi:hypothetical protein APICC_04485 [Apis cerana cerana]|uniref:Uncharacterized protein n=1 Tax=Apis cerana cerana TaxID=94128 RepID=A0A2A3E4B8_APICC|nr:hypothetical protein APICC_04485 [Apis cerana cerana]